MLGEHSIPIGNLVTTSHSLVAVILIHGLVVKQLGQFAKLVRVEPTDEYAGAPGKTVDTTSEQPVK
jgi:hypothetical protein